MNERRKERNIYWLSKAPVWKSLFALAFPTIMAQMIAVVYNIADTLFIGRLNDPSQVAAVTYVMPLMIIFNAIANLFGVGGAALIAHALGRKDIERAKIGASFSLFYGLIVAIIYTILILSLKRFIYPSLGGSAETLLYMEQYAFYTIILGTIPAVMNPLLAHLLRGEGRSFPASFGVTLGGLLNIALDPLFIFVFKMEVAGAGLATFLSNVIACIYLIVYALVKRKTTTVNLNLKHFPSYSKVALEILVAGIPNAVISIMASSSNIVTNILFSPYGESAVAGWGIAKKIDILAFAIAQGMTQGALPLISYSYSAKNKERMMSSIKLAFLYSLVLGIAGMAFMYFLARPMSKLFIEDETTVTYASTLTRILSLTCITTAPSFMAITVFQSLGKKWQPFFLSFFRKGILNIAFSLALAKTPMRENGIAAATPIADALAMTITLTLFFIYFRKFLKAINSSPEWNIEKKEENPAA